MCSARIVPEEEAQGFLRRQKAASVELEDKDKRIAEAFCECWACRGRNSVQFGA